MKHTTFVVTFVSLVIVAIVICGQTLARGPSDAPVFDTDGLYREVRQIVRRHYPQATSHRLGNKMHFEHDTRIFLMHAQNKFGEWQDAHQERGPKKNGIYCRIELRKGKYIATAPVPQTIGGPYFNLLLLGVYSKKLDAHLYVHLKYPANVPKGFLTEITKLLNNFDKYVNTNAG